MLSMQMFQTQPGAKPYEITAQLLAVIAHPMAEDVEKRQVTTDHLKAGYARWLRSRDKASAERIVPLDDALVDAKEAAWTLRKLETTLRKRLLAGHMAIHFLKPAEQEPTAST